MNQAFVDHVEVEFEAAVPGLLCLGLSGTEAVGECSRFEVELSSEVPLETEAILGRWAILHLVGQRSSRVVTGVVMRLRRRAGGSYEKRRYLYRVVIESSIARLRLTRRSRIFQNQTLPDIIKSVLASGGLDPKNLTLRLSRAPEPLPTVVQYDESDATFLRRLCERGGLHYYFTSGDDPKVAEEHLVLSDDSTLAKPTLAPLSVVEGGALLPEGLFARRLRLDGALRPGKITLRDYDYEKPATPLEATRQAGTDLERTLERYQAPAGFRSGKDGSSLAETRLEAARADGRRVVFESNALALTPGACFELEALGDGAQVVAEGRHVVVSVGHEFTRSVGFRIRVTAIPQKTPLRLPEITPARRIAGIQSAWVTGPGSEEVHTDALGRVHLRFSWDRQGPEDEKSGPPVRVLQANLGDSMVTPRVGWEVWVGFEGGDPERPVVLGRCFNALQPPPYALPANKTVSTLRSFSSPGAGAMNSIEFQDAAGAQGLTLHAGSGKSTTVGGNLTTQTDKAETRVVGAAQIMSIAGSENVSVKEAYIVGAGTQIATVGGSQDIGVKGRLDVQVGSETVSIGGALLEQIGSPAAIALNLASAMAVSGATSQLAQKWLGGKGQVLAAGIQLGQALHGGGVEAAEGLAGTMALGHLASAIPGGQALLLGEKKHGPVKHFPWEPEEKQAGPDAPKEADVAANSAGGGASAGGAGNKNQLVNGNAIEMVGGAHSIVTPARVDWETAGGAAQLVVGACHVTSCASASLEVLGASAETVGAHLVKAGGAATRTVKALASTQCGALTINSTGNLTAKATSIELTCAALTLTGSSVTFKCGSSVVAFSESGLLVKSGSIKLTKSSTQSADTKH